MVVTDAAQVPGFEGYWVTRDGRILSYWRPDGPNKPYRVREDLPVKTLVPRPNSNGYLRVSLGSGVDRYVHRLVAETFLGEIPDGYQVRHLDGDRQNNSVDNLAIGTRMENELDKVRHGTLMKGVSHVNSVLTEEDVLQARVYWRSGMDLPEIRKRLNFKASKSAIHSAVIGKTWAHAPGPVGKRERRVWRSNANSN